MFRLLASTAAVALISTAAVAADLPLPEEPIPVAVAGPGFSWTGVYLGAQGGWGWANFLRDTGGAPTSDWNPDGGIAGGHIAALYQWNWVVVGLEGDGEWWGIEGDDGGQAGVTDDVEGNWLASIRGRLGVGIDRILLYGTGGWQWGDVDIEQTAGGASATLGVTFDGWTAGGGVEYAVTDHFIAGIEYRFTDFDRESVGATAVAVAGGYDVEVVKRFADSIIGPGCRREKAGGI
jgi:outer membrane immunogenic protein